MAYLFVLHGVLAIIKFFVALQQSNIRIDIGVLCLFAGLGLFRLSPGWWKFAKLYTLLYLVGTPVALLLLGNAAPPLSASIMKIPIGSVRKEPAILLLVLCWLVALWEYRVLTSRQVTELHQNEAKLYWD